MGAPTMDGGGAAAAGAGGAPRRLVLLRHGQSVWNRDNVFTGWTDVDLSEQGRDEAAEAGRLLAGSGIRVDRCFTSVLRRAVRTLWIVQDRADLMWLPVTRSWRLNERHYGALQGRDKDETREQVGEAQVRRWRRSYDVPPPPLDDAGWAALRADPRYARVPDGQLPRGESLAATVARVLPFWQAEVEPVLMAGGVPLVVAHGNTLRAIVKYLDAVPEADVPGLEIPTGRPLVYDLDAGLRPLGSRYLGAGAAD